MTTSLVKPIDTTISTRGIGFGTSLLLYVTDRYKKNIDLPDVNQLYRVFLGILESKMQEMIGTYGDCVIDIGHVRKRKLQEFISTSKRVTRLPEPINRIIKTAGQVTQYETKYLPYLLEVPRMPEMVGRGKKKRYYLILKR